jgi:hypothetical protein
MHASDPGLCVMTFFAMCVIWSTTGFLVDNDSDDLLGD